MRRTFFSLTVLSIFCFSSLAWAGDPIFPSDPVRKPRLIAHLVRVHPVDAHTSDVEEIQVKKDANGNPDPSLGVVVVWSMRVSTDQIASASVGVVFTKPECKLYNMVFVNVPTCKAVGFLAQTEAGLAGAKVSLGYGEANAIGGKVLNFPFSGWDVKASTMVTWRNQQVLGGQVTPGDVYAGLEVDATFLLKFSIGLLRRIGGDVSTPGWIFILGTGVGF